MKHACVLLAYFPHLYKKLDDGTKHQIKEFDNKEVVLFKWFITGNLGEYIDAIVIESDYIEPKILRNFEAICKVQGQPQLFVRFLINHYSQSKQYTRARNRFDCIIEPYLSKFCHDDFLQLLQTINNNSQIYNYIGQKARNDKILEFAKPLLGEDFDYTQYPHFEYTEEPKDETTDEATDVYDLLGREEAVPDDDPDLPF